MQFSQYNLIVYCP